jgi:hypothetical protein
VSIYNRNATSRLKILTNVEVAACNSQPGSAGTVRFGSGLGGYSPNVESRVRFVEMPNIEPERRVQVRHLEPKRHLSK